MELGEKLDKIITQLSDEIITDMEKGITFEKDVVIKGVSTDKANALAQLIQARALVNNYSN